MKYLRRFNESVSDDFEDYLFSIFERDADESLKGDEWFWGRWWSPINKNLDDLLSSPRFANLIVLKEWFGGFDDGCDILIVSPDYYQKMSKWQVGNLKWERHPIAIELDKNPELKKFTSSSKLISDKAAIVNGLPNGCSLIRGMRFGDGLEFWPQKHTADPIYVETEVELQALIYKYICDEPIREGFLDFFKKKPNPVDFYIAGESWFRGEINGIEVHIQPGVQIEKSILDPAIDKIKKLSQKWHLVDQCNVYNVAGSQRDEYSNDDKRTFIKFRLSDIEGDNQWGTDGEIPNDIKEEIISDVRRSFGDQGLKIDEFPFQHILDQPRGYIIFEYCLKS